MKHIKNIGYIWFLLAICRTYCLVLTWNLNPYGNLVEWNPFVSAKIDLVQYVLKWFYDAIYTKKNYILLYFLRKYILIKNLCYDSNLFIHNYNLNIVIWFELCASNQRVDKDKHKLVLIMFLLLNHRGLFYIMDFLKKRRYKHIKDLTLTFCNH